MDRPVPMEFDDGMDIGGPQVPTGLIPQPSSAPAPAPGQPLNQAYFEDNLQLNKPDTQDFTNLILSRRHVLGLIVRQAGAQDAAQEASLVQAFLLMESIQKRAGATDPRLKFYFADTLVMMDDYDYAIKILNELKQGLTVQSPFIDATITLATQRKAARIAQSENSLQVLVTQRANEIGYIYKPGQVAPLPNDRTSFEASPIVQFYPFSGDKLAPFEIARMLRSVSINTNLIEGVLNLSAGATATLITLGFASSSFGHITTNDVSKEYIQQVLVDSQAATKLVEDRVGASNQPFNVAFVKDLHSVFTVTACTVTQNGPGPGQKTTAYIGRGQIKFLSNHVFARTGKFHIYCPPASVESELNTVLGMLQNYLTSLPKTMSNGLWLAAWFHHRFVNIHPFRDGNGRVTRALTSAILIKFGLLPLLVSMQDKPDYLYALMKADDGDLRYLARFLGRQQLQAYFVAKSADSSQPSNMQVSEFRKKRMVEADQFIGKLLNELSQALGYTLQQAADVPQMNVTIFDVRTFALKQNPVPPTPRNIYIVYGSLWPIETDLFVLYVLTYPVGVNQGTGSVRALTGLKFGDNVDLWTKRLGEFITSEVKEIITSISLGGN